MIVAALVVAGGLGVAFGLTALRLAGEKERRAKAEALADRLAAEVDRIAKALADAEAEHGKDERAAEAVIASLRKALARANDTLRNSDNPGTGLERLRMLSAEAEAADRDKSDG